MYLSLQKTLFLRGSLTLLEVHNTGLKALSVSLAVGRLIGNYIDAKQDCGKFIARETIISDLDSARRDERYENELAQPGFSRQLDLPLLNTEPLFSALRFYVCA